MAKKLMVVAFCFFFATTLLAVTEPKWPKIVRELSDADFKPTVAKDIPEGVSFYIRGKDTPETYSKRIIRISRIDLDGDAIPELLVAMDAGGRNGPNGDGHQNYYDIYQKQGDLYKPIGYLNAAYRLRILSKNNGFYQIEIHSDCGSAHYLRELFRYERGAYRNIRTDSYHFDPNPSTYPK